jgi:hypothetical protein
MVRGNYLFCSADSFAVEEHQRKSMLAEIASMDGDRLLNTNVDDLGAYFGEKFAIDVPQLLEDQMTVDEREAQRDLSGDPRRTAYHLGHRGLLMVTGTEVLVDLPFSGDPQMLNVRPKTFNTSCPAADVHGNVLTFSIWGDNLTSG